MGEIQNAHEMGSRPLAFLSEPISVGGVKIRNRVFLAPMSGVTDLPFRQLAWRHGAGMVVTEMIASGELAAANEESCRRLRGDGLDLHVVQIAGREAAPMAEAARLAEAGGADIIDINMGCPAKKVTGGYSGSALMRDPAHALSLIEATVSAVRVPVTLKMRLGWDETSINAPEIARRAEEAGVQMITVHGRTRCQFYEGRADWQAIRAVREAITVPLVANGDVVTLEDAERIRMQSGADAVMIGRGAQGRPWFPGAVAAGFAGDEPPELVAEIAIAHFEAMLSHYGTGKGVRHARKHLGWYLDRFAAPHVTAGERGRILTGTDPAEIERLVADSLAGPVPAMQTKKVA